MGRLLELTCLISLTLPFVSGECVFFPFPIGDTNQGVILEDDEAVAEGSHNPHSVPLKISSGYRTKEVATNPHFGALSSLFFFPFPVGLSNGEILAANTPSPSEKDIALDNKRNPYPLPKRLSAGYRTRGVGYNANYETLSTLITPQYKRGVGLPMIDLRAHHLDNGNYAGNFGLGIRFVPNYGCQIFGVNAYYDFRTTHRGNYNQFGLGLELLSKRWGLHFNGYLPVGGSKHGKRFVYDDFVGNYRAVCRRSEYAFDSFNLGFDFQIVHDGGFFLFGAISPYYVSSTHQGDHSLGIKGGIRPQFGDYLSIDLNVSHDEVFGTIFQGAAIFTLPLYSYSSKKYQKGPCGLRNRQIYQPVQRDEIIKLRRSPCCFKTNF